MSDKSRYRLQHRGRSPRYPPQGTLSPVIPLAYGILGIHGSLRHFRYSWEPTAQGTLSPVNPLAYGILGIPQKPTAF